MLAAMDDALTRGFDGLYLDIVDAFETYEQNGEEYADNRLNPDTRQSYRRDMVDWVKWIATRARAKNPAALIVPQNGSQLLSHADFLAAISAIGIEDLFTSGDKLQPVPHEKCSDTWLDDDAKAMLLISIETRNVRRYRSNWRRKTA